MVWTQLLDPRLAPALAAGWVVAWSTIAYVAMALDKTASRTRGQRRIPERRLLGLTLVGGAHGTWLAMRVLRHKTRHVRFRVLTPLAAVAWTLAIAATLVVALGT